MVSIKLPKISLPSIKLRKVSRIPTITVKDSTQPIDGQETRAYDVMRDAVGGKAAAQKLGLTQRAPIDVNNIFATVWERIKGSDNLPDHEMNIPVDPKGRVIQEDGMVKFPLAKPFADAVKRTLEHDGMTEEGSVSLESVELKPNGTVLYSTPPSEIVDWGPFKK